MQKCAFYGHKYPEKTTYGGERKDDNDAKISSLLSILC